MVTRRVSPMAECHRPKKACILLDITNLATDLIGPVNLSIAAGECVAVLGASGSGKSLLLRAIADLDPHDGEVSLTGRRCSEMPADEWRRLVALVPAESGWWSDYVGEHFASAPDPAALLEAVGLSDAFGWEVARLSTGERHRLAIARALQGQPQTLLLDEPTASLDAEATQHIERLLNQQLKRGVAVLLVTHDHGQARRLAARSYEMTGGQLVQMAEVEP